MPNVLLHHYMPSHKDGVRLRPFPYPYRSMLSICSDIDDSTPELFQKIHEMLSVEMGLEVADSLFVWANDRRFVGMMEGDMPTSMLPAMKRLHAEGWLDSIHGLGDFNSQGHFTRDLAKKAYHILEEHGIKIDVWTNHGNWRNHQNFASRHPTHIGDDPRTPDTYHFDLAEAYGIRFYWWQELANLPLSCAHPDKMAIGRRMLRSYVKNVLKGLLGRSHSAIFPGIYQELAYPVVLHDGKKLWAFTRYNNDPLSVWRCNPGRHSFRYQLTDEFLGRMASSGGYAVLYTHFGQPEWDPETPLFDSFNLEALHRLKDAQERKDVLVATTKRLLHYWHLYHYLDWRVEKVGSETHIHLEATQDPVSGRRRIAIEDLSGLAFECPTNAKVFLEGNEIHAFVPYAEGVHLPWKPLALPDKGFAL